jgi:ferritin
MLSKKIETALNKQIAVEAEASYYYLAIGSWCDSKGLHGCAQFMFRQSEEEREHMIKLFHYINEAGGFAVTPAIKKPTSNFKDIKQVFKGVLAREQGTTKGINALVDLCIKEKDHSTNNFLQWYVAEQHEEENKIRTILEKIDLVGSDSKGAYWIDKEIGASVAQ